MQGASPDAAEAVTKIVAEIAPMGIGAERAPRSRLSWHTGGPENRKATIPAAQPSERKEDPTELKNDGMIEGWSEW